MPRPAGAPGRGSCFSTKPAVDRSTRSSQPRLFAPTLYRPLIGLQPGDQAGEDGLPGGAGGSGEHALDRAHEVLRLADSWPVDDRVAVPLALEQAALCEAVKHGLHGVVGAAIARRQRVADLRDGAGLEAPENPQE